MAATALQYPRIRLLAVVGHPHSGVHHPVIPGTAILKEHREMVEKSRVQGLLAMLIILCTVGTAVSVYGGVHRTWSSCVPAGREERHGPVRQPR
jgi:hypothetical protein